MSNELIQIANVERHYRRGKVKLHALNGVDLSVNRGRDSWYSRSFWVG